ICFAAATEEHKAVYYTTLAEPHNKLVRFLEGFEFFDTDAIEKRVEYINLADLLLEEDTAGDGPLGPLITEIVRTCFERKPRVVVIDGAKALRDFVDPVELRKVLYDLAGKVAHSESVVLLLGEYSADELETSAEFSLADGIVQLAYVPHEPIDRRWLRVLKLRGSNHLAGRHSLHIGDEGMYVHPRLESLTLENAVLNDGRVSTGNLELDEMMGGGIPAGDVTALVGPSGSGKTAAALRFVAQGIEDGERCLFVSFQEDPGQLVRKAASFGWDLAAAQKSGQLEIHHTPQGHLDLDVLGNDVRTALRDGSIRRVAIDSLAELVYSARESERFPAYSRMLTGFLRAGGATSVITSEVATLGPMTAPVGGLSFLFHNIVLLRYVELESEVRRAVAVLKMRDSNHDKGVRQYEITSKGMVLGEKLEDLTGLLGWSALRARQEP
ncbi:MAG: circadian clock protein KaiC, partial [Actinomycetota bacterium]|nr:circadian clock protein KaiC [Actinomycetota bacterium]